MNNKLLRSELKSIVKECLVEILSEGLNQDNITNKSINENTKNLSPSSSERKIRKSKRKKKIKSINTKLTDNPVLNEMLAETASSTLNEQILADNKNPVSLTATQGDSAAKIVDSTNPEDLFGDASDKWASLAFS